MQMSQHRKDLWRLNDSFFKKVALLFLIENAVYVILRLFHLNFSQSLMNGGEIYGASVQKLQMFGKVENGMEWILCLTILAFAERSARRFGLPQSMKWLTASFVGLFLVRYSIRWAGTLLFFYGPNYSEQLMRPMSWILGLLLIEGVLFFLSHFSSSFSTRSNENR